jgi:4'-phosphopantetheinyl transferase
LDGLEVRHPAPFPVAVSWLDPVCAPTSAPLDRPGGRPFTPPEGGVTLVLLTPDAERDVSIFKTSLSPSERARLYGIQHPRALAEFVAGRRLIREVLGALLDVAARDVTLVESVRGALSVDPIHASPLRFNLSHTEGLVVLAVAGSDVGVDVEWLDRKGRTVELADRYFAPAEATALRALPTDQQRDRFFDLWTLKESYIKARGLGLAIPLASFAFSGFEGPGLRVTVDPAHADRLDAAWSFGVWQHECHRLAVTLGR